ncbi:hypothetical protein [Pantoea sp. App145]|uniref:hypothetical protein n=1 Tax=Pantoea sp. App145 TaxID=3071567 RepID=UPI003A7FA314
MIKRTQFIKKALELSELILPEIRSKEKRLALISGEKETTVKNWIFHDKIPVSSKRLHISDSFGVSEQSLFDLSEKHSIPVAVFNRELNCYLIPQIDESGLERLLSATPPLIATERVPLKLQDFLKDDIAIPHLTYCINVVKLVFPPFILESDIIFINHTASRKGNIFCVYTSGSQVQIVKIKCSDGRFILINKEGCEVRIEENSFVAPVILTLSRGYFHEV